MHPPIDDLHESLTPRACSRANKKSYKVGEGEGEGKGAIERERRLTRVCAWPGIMIGVCKRV